MVPLATQCPLCGNFFAAEPAAETATCPACGAGLRLGRSPSGHPLARPLDEQPAAKLAEALAARQALAAQLRWRLQDLAAQREKLDSQIEPDALAAAGAPPNEGSLVTLATVGAVVGGLVSCLVLLGMGNILRAPYNAADEFARRAICCLLPAVALTVAAWLYRGHLLTEEDRWHQRYAEGRRSANRKYGPEIARIDQETGTVEARLRELGAEIEDLARQV